MIRETFQLRLRGYLKNLVSEIPTVAAFAVQGKGSAEVAGLPAIRQNTRAGRQYRTYDISLAAIYSRQLKSLGCNMAIVARDDLDGIRISIILMPSAAVAPTTTVRFLEAV